MFIDNQKNEARMSQRGQDKRARNIQRNREEGRSLDNAPERRIVFFGTQLVADEIRRGLAPKLERIRTGRKFPGFKFMVEEFGIEDVAAISLATIIDTPKLYNAQTQYRQAGSIVHQIAQRIMLTHVQRWIKRNEPGKWAFMEGTRSLTSGRLHAELRRQLKLREDIRQDMPELDEVKKIAAVGLQAVLNTGMYETRTVKRGRRFATVVVPTESTRRKLEGWTRDLIASGFAPGPMTSAPRPWTSATDGGFETIQTDLISQGYYRSAAAETDGGEPIEGEALRAVNIAQATEFAINGDVVRTYAVLRDLRGPEGDMPGLRYAPVEDCPEELERGTEAYGRFHGLRAKVLDANSATKGNITLADAACAEAERLIDEPSIWFVPFLDSRGRLYYQSAGQLDPQGPDHIRAMLRFSERLPLGEHGLRYLKIHGANQIDGVDKLPLADRVQWVEDHEEAIRRIASDPVGNLEWASEVDGYEVDQPWQFLAFCLDYVEALEDGKSSLPVAIDATCSGIQIYSGCLRDEVGGRMTALTPQERPSDLYREVAAAAISAIEASNDAEAKKLAELGLVCRSSAKKPAMTFTYGVSERTAKKDIGEWIEGERRKALGRGEKLAMGDLTSARAGQIIGGFIWQELLGKVPASYAAMRALKRVGSALGKADVVARWSMPDGLECEPIYKASRQVGKIIAPKFVGASSYLKITDYTPSREVDTVKQANGTSPNVVHSIDAYLMRETIRRCEARGVTSFALIHDSFATHAGNLHILAEEVREAFIYVCEQKVLQNVYAHLVSLCPADKLPEDLEFPSEGTLDVSGVRDSEYFFS